MKVHGLTLALAALMLTGCGGTETLDRTCDEVRPYQMAQEGRRIDAPDDLSELDPLQEMPLPEPSPRPPREKGLPCLDLPPNILGGEE